MYTLEQAVGFKIPWPVDKVVLLDGVGSPSGNKSGSKGTSSGDESYSRCRIYDWNFDGEITAEGMLCSTDPKSMVNNIPLGPNAAIVKIDKVVKEAVYLWRPTSEMLVVKDAIGFEIAWPADKVELLNLQPRDQSVRGSPGTASTTSGSSKGSKKKCILMDCNNSGDKVAEGRVCSTNPTDVVHFKPLGPNASKVWVEVSKIGDARVWRPNSEIKYISDAIGTTVAWPNEKIVYL